MSKLLILKEKNTSQPQFFNTFCFSWVSLPLAVTTPTRRNLMSGSQIVVTNLRSFFIIKMVVKEWGLHQKLLQKMGVTWGRKLNNGQREKLNHNSRQCQEDVKWPNFYLWVLAYIYCFQQF